MNDLPTPPPHRTTDLPAFLPTDDAAAAAAAHHDDSPPPPDDYFVIDDPPRRPPPPRPPHPALPSPERTASSRSSPAVDRMLPDDVGPR